MEMPKFLQKAKEYMFPSHDPEENQAAAINQAAKKEAGVELPEKPEPAKVNQAAEGMKAARENLADKGKSPIEEGKGKKGNFCTLKIFFEDFPADPVVKNPHFHCWGYGLAP